jgi:hypothetical protein
MKPKISVLVLLIALLAVAGVAIAAPTAFSIPWWTVDSGGGTSQGGDYAVSGTIGQPDAGEVMSGGDYTLVGGFWGVGTAAPVDRNIYLPVVIR